MAQRRKSRCKYRFGSDDEFKAGARAAETLLLAGKDDAVFTLRMTPHLPRDFRKSLEHVNSGNSVITDKELSITIEGRGVLQK